ncbi:cysteine proteinase [Coprinellus micaceus]|uniref:Ubiquitin carboxyl-terminal hydrolase n=1 Tax=Coprinellus micaceus TaxID=71717 RepID=A0A4Y7SLW3_COPMI|nr:cysteine proteinase [Coprinellus micaceus]
MSKLGPWIPLESNPEVFNKWAQRAGLVTKQDAFGDVYGLDDDILAIVPQPTQAVILLFPDVPEAKAHQTSEDERIAKDGQPHLDPTIFYVKQTIGNACGTIALIHALANSKVTWAPNSPLHDFIAETQGKNPEERAQLLETRPLFANIHAETAQEGQSAPNIDTDLHFVCFVAAPDADLRKVAKGQESPTDAAAKTDGDHDTGMRDLLKDVAKVIKERYLTQTESVYFSLMALGPSTD